MLGQGTVDIQSLMGTYQSGTALASGTSWNYCPTCGKKITAGWAYCPGCGLRMQQYAPYNTAVSSGMIGQYQGTQTSNHAGA